MDEILQHNNQTYIRASSTLADQRLRVLKHDEVFGIFDMFGDIKPVGIGSQGLYCGSTRFISQMELRVGGRYPTLLSSTITNDDILMTADLSNPHLFHPDSQTLPHSTFHIFREKFLSEDSCYERLYITNFSNAEHVLPLAFLFKTDFADMFEVRGIAREKRGTPLPVRRTANQIIFNYKGADDKIRGCRLSFNPAPLELTELGSRFVIPLGPKERTEIFVTTTCFQGEPVEESPLLFSDAFSRIESGYKRNVSAGCQVESSSERFRTWVDRSKADILLMTTNGEYGGYPYAGIPWFNTVFGRDGLITALQYLWVDPSTARGVLTYLARLQATDDSAYEDAEPGKILHELRTGEMVDTGEVPFKRYYGSVDSTPLFILLAGRYLETTADIPFIEKLWPSIEAGLKWIDEYGDQDRDGFVEYFRRSPKGLENQGWKDSFDSVSHADGRLAEGPIALCEVQGYVYAAKLEAAKIARHLGLDAVQARLTKEAEALSLLFQQRFWLPDKGFPALALDGRKNPCRVLSSNAGQTLLSGIVSPEQAAEIAANLFSEKMYSGWGIRTLATDEVRYNPMSYHNGSIWPHDNSLIAEGFARYGLKDEVLKIAEALFDVSVNVDLFRLPELFCGFPRREGQGPTLYPVACSPQAWAAGSVFMVLKACLGLEVDGFSNLISFRHPVLPYAIQELRLKRMKVGTSEVDLLFRRHGTEVSVYVERRSGKVEVSVLK